MRLAVLIPAARAARTLGQALESVASQTRAPQRTLVVTSPDDHETLAVARHHAAEILQQTSSSPAQARNRGMLALEGSADWIAFLDADDWWDPGWLRQAEDAILAHPAAALVAGGILESFSDGTRVARSLPPDLEQHPFERLLIQTCITTSAVLVRSSALPSHAPFDERADAIGEDYALWLELAARHDVVTVPGHWVYYRRHAESVSNRIDRFEDMRRQHLLIVEGAMARRAVSPEIRRQALANVYRQSAERLLHHGQRREARRDLRLALQLSPAEARLWLAAALSAISHDHRAQLLHLRRWLRSVWGASETPASRPGTKEQAE
ncbi:MAG: glycosyltransferase family 2 protein [Pseudomonadota bacterium]